MCFKAYDSTKKIEWAQSALSILPYALRYKTHKTKLILAPAIKILSSLQKNKEITDTLATILDFIPIRPFLLWLPHILRIAEN
jgi:hypothetical protein